MTLYLLDNSVLQRIPRSPVVQESVARLMGKGDLLACSDMSLLEAGYSGTSVEHHREILATWSSSLLRLGLSDEVGTVALGIQTAMFAAGVGRAAGTFDLLQAASAIVHGAVVVHYDADFEHIAACDARLVQQWIVPRGSLD
jgi:predicted nucleic acid-binding protein